jgi:hypothetical protein
MKTIVSYFENSSKIENHKRVGFQIERDDGEKMIIDRHIKIVDGKSEEDYIDEAYKAKGRNGKTAKAEIEAFEIWEKPKPLHEQQEKIEVASAVGKEWNASKKSLK